MPDIRPLIQPLLDHAAFRAVREALREGAARESRTLTLSGLTRPAKALVVAGLAHQVGRPAIVLTSDNEAAEQLRASTATFLEWLEPGAGARVQALPAFDCSPYEGRSPHAEVQEQRAVALWSVGCARTRALYVPLPAAMGRFRAREYYGSLALELRVGDELNLDDLLEHLRTVGYESGEPVAEVGQFSVRGGIVDVFPPEASCPFRLEFFGDQVESVREFDPATQRSRQAAPSALLLPLAETQRSGQFFATLVKVLRQRAPHRRAAAGATARDSEAEPEWAPEYSGPFPGWEFFAPLVEPQPNSLLALFRSPVLVWDEPLERQAQLKETLEGLAAGFDEGRDIVPPRPKPEEMFLSEQEFLHACESAPQLFLKELAVTESKDAFRTSIGVPAVPNQVSAAEPVGELEEKTPSTQHPAPSTLDSVPSTQHPAPSTPQSAPSPELVLLTQPTPKFQGGVKALAEDLRARLEQGMAVVFVMPTAGKIDRLREILTEYQLPFGSVEPTPIAIDSAGAEKSGPIRGIWIARGEIAEGVVIPELGLTWLADRDLFGGFDWGATRRRERAGISSFISDLSDLKVGDYVVHVDHGIALYRGLRQLSVGGATRDFMLLTYQEDAKLYVPLERLDLVERYRSGGDGAKPALDRLGGATWERTKTRVKRALRDMAQELLQLYAERKMRGGVPASADTPWQKEFEDAFEFEETPDQLTAVADIKRDLESPDPMDRLLCGDVGYGKTELAMRAAFKVVQDGRQVALLAPTTVLAFQHYTTFRQRMSAFPIRVEMLSRFRSAAEQKKVVADAEAGRVDILIGTHRLLSKDVRFRELGLLVVDEEQRFGVAAKERLKKLRAQVDVLTMSATPIPRTLHMSLGGLRDFSVIETPPRGRLAIQTVVAPFGQALIQSAILQEMQRQGQVFFVHNRVESIFTIAALLQRLVPTARIGVAHGQMGEKDLERVMLKFMQGEYEVLAATALIENGLDIPRANTMIVNHADRFGLADLYQLRGRVGRSSRRAYAYFLIPAEETLTPTAKRRLAALKEFSDLGAGFRLAALDLELRGAGNLLGREQHGHLDAIGIDLYLRMLEQTVEELKGAPAKLEVRTSLNLGLDIKIPDTYIADESQRLRMYKRISSLATPEARPELEAELADRFGPIPPSVSNLLAYAQLKSAAERLLVQSIERKGEEILMRFHQQAPVDAKKLMQFLRRQRPSEFRPDGLLRFRLRAPDGKLIDQVQNVLQELRAAN
ncbi:MAG: transcription-repair coupling factor [Acidobacteriia bacterium]|nr:transcription-repair coupling factor [Terriglobia bacterium]